MACQERPDGDFKTCEYPNPETDAALRESYLVAENAACDLILGTDPDCDRVAIAVPCDGGFKKLSGNELGFMLLEYVLSALTQKGMLPKDAVAVRSIVSSPLADRVCEHYGVQMRSVLTGFKYIGGEILKLEEKGCEERFVFGFEESCGYLKGTYARDKDAVVASMLICEMAASLKSQGMTILDKLNSVYEQYGHYLTSVKSVELTGADAMEKAANIMLRLRDKAPVKIGGLDVSVIKDYKAQTELDVLNGGQKEIALPASNVLEYVLGQSGSVIVRPSGTEPKVKYYFTAIGATPESAEEKLAAMMNEMLK